MPFEIEKALDFDRLSDVQLSPDGQYVAYVLGQRFKPAPHTPPDKSIYLVEVSTGKTRRLTASDTGSNESPRWSPDGKRLAFLSNRRDGRNMQVYVIDIDGGEAQTVTHLHDSASWLQWTPDGHAVTFLCSDLRDTDTSPDPIVMDANPLFQRLWIVDIESGSVRPITPVDYHIHEYAASPDGTTFALVASMHPNPMEGWYAARLYTARAGDGELQAVCSIENQIGRLTWSPDSQSIAFVSGVMSDEGNIAGEIFTVAAAGGTSRNLTPGIDHSITWITWETQGILYGARHIEAALLGWLDPESGALRQITRGLYAINGSLAEEVSVQGDIFAAIRESFTEPPNIYIGSLERDDWRQLTTLPSDPEAFPPLHVENKYWNHPDGTPVHGYLVFPPGYQPGISCPMVVNVHGGPS
ncbi:MAG TPA: hypothetical protein VJZ27_00710, partial [Aggregatilineales bacterium]|nr:hypothetical protein [Aggregatilineales bacterium]